MFYKYPPYLLLNYPLDCRVENKNYQNQTALDFAIMYDMPHSVRVLINNAHPINDKDY